MIDGGYIMDDYEYAEMLAWADRRRTVIEEAMRSRRPLPGESTPADERHYAEGYAYACGYHD